MSPSSPPLITRLHAVAQNLSPAQRRIGDCLLEHFGEAPFWGVEYLAAKSKVSVATVVRFAQFLGYEGFLDMRHALVAQAKREAGPEHRLLQAPVDASALLVDVATRDVTNIQRTVQGVNEKLLGAVVKRLAGARHRLILGRGVSALMSEHLAYLLTQAGLPTISGSAADFATQVANLTSKDVLVAFSFPPYTRETVDAAAYARKHAVPLVAFTDRLDSPLGKLAEHTMVIAGENLLYSFSPAAFSVVAHAIATTLASKDRQAALKRLKEADRVARPQFKED